MTSRSIIWYHFQKFKQDNHLKAKCRYCQAVIAVAGGGTSNCRRHLINKHPTISLDYQTAVFNNASHTVGSPEDERTRVIIKEEIDVPQDDNFICSPNEDGSQMEFENPNNTKQFPFLDVNKTKNKSINSHTEVPGLKEQRHVEPVQNSGLSGIFKMVDALSLDIQNILTEEIHNLGNMNPRNIRSRPTLSNPATSIKMNPANPKSDFPELEVKLRIHYLTTIIKKEEELMDLKLKLCKLQIKREERQLDNITKIQSLTVEKLELENAILKSKLGKQISPSAVD